MEQGLRSNRDNFILFIERIRNIGLFLFKKFWGQHQSGSLDILHTVINYKSAAFYQIKSVAAPNFISGAKSKKLQAIWKCFRGLL
jgi:hypothetical protein